MSRQKNGVYRVTFVLDYATISTVVEVSGKEQDDDIVTDVASKFLADEYGLDMDELRCCDVDVEAATA